MTVKRKVSSKKVLGIILGLLLICISTISTKALDSNHTTSPSTTIEYTTNQRVIGIKNNYKGKKMIVGATAYCNDPITYIGTVPKVNYTIAVDPNVIPLGSRVYIPRFNKVFIAEDTGSKIKGNRIDIYMKDYNTCMQWGIQNIEIIVLD